MMTSKLVGQIGICFLMGLPAVGSPLEGQKIPVDRGDKKTISTTVFLPNGDAARSWPLVIVMHGSGAVNRFAGMEALVRRALTSGYAVAVYDKRGIATQNDGTPLITEDFITADSRTLTADAERVLTTLSTLKFVKRDAIYLLAHSEGTVIATRLLEKVPHLIRGVFALGINTLGFEHALQYQSLELPNSIFDMADGNKDQQVSAQEISELNKAVGGRVLFGYLVTLLGRIFEPDQLVLEWMEHFDLYHDGMISRYEWAIAFQTNWVRFASLIQGDDPMPVPYYTKAWFRQVLEEGSYLYRQSRFCGKWRLFHGETDEKTPIGGAKALQRQCASQGAHVPFFRNYALRDHHFNLRPMGPASLLETDDKIDDPELIRDFVRQLEAVKLR